MSRGRRFLAVLAWCFFAAIAIAEDVIVRRNVHLREGPSTNTRSLRLLQPPDELELLDPTPQDGFLRVITEDNEEGWVWSRNVRLGAPAETETPVTFEATDGAAEAISENWAKPDPDTRTFTLSGERCGPTGSGDKRDQETNRRKNRIDVPSSYHRVTWEAIASLPAPPKPPKSREKLTHEQLAMITRFEGVAVQTVGYLVAIKPQRGSGESTNCYWTSTAGTDWHIALVKEPGDGEKTSIVVEPTPRIKKHHPKWTTANLKPWLDTDLPVRISGWLLFDPQHTNHMGKYRNTLWEIHPITKMEVWDDDRERWVNLDNFP